MKKCSILLLCALSASTYANYKALSPNYRDYFTVNFANTTPAASILTVDGSVTVENLNCGSTNCSFDLYGGSGEEDTGVATLLLGNPSNGFCTIVIPDGSKVTDVIMYPACVNAKSSPLQQRAHSHEYSFTITGNNPGPNPESKYKVGDLAEGGIVIDVDSTGEHGVVAAYSNVTFSETGWDAGTQQQAVTNCSKMDSGQAGSSWRLPSIEELKKIDLNRNLLPELIQVLHQGTDPLVPYWSSTIYDRYGEMAYSLVFRYDTENASVQGSSTNQDLFAHCVRSF